MNRLRLGFWILLIILCLPRFVHPFNLDAHLSDLRSKDTIVRKKALIELCKYLIDGPEEGDEEPWSREKFDLFVNTLIELSYDPDPEIRAWAIHCPTTDTRMIEPTARLLRDTNDNVRATAASVFFITEVNDPKIIRELERLLKDRNRTVRDRAAMALGINGTWDSLILLQIAYEEETDQEVRNAIGWSLKRLKGSLGPSRIQVAKSDYDAAISTLRRYIQCEKNETFTNCYSLLSGRTLDTWASLYNVKTKEEYAEIKSSEETSLRECQILEVKQLMEDIRIITECKTIGEAQGTRKRDFLFVNEEGTWKIDRMIGKDTEYLP